ncbi:MAG TPA: hypothetical protein VKU77_15060 [Streptosporangiaceae bacterium]|nr:hypothetical protein [Streptosporangiaceae bacterium]
MRFEGPVPAQDFHPHLTRRELEAMAGGRLTARSGEKCLDLADPRKLRWRAEFTRG